MDSKKCIYYGDCGFNHMDCEEDEPFFKCPDRATEPRPLVSTELAGSIAEVDDLAMLVRRLVRVVRMYKEDNPVAIQALDYLDRHNLKSSPLK